MIRGMRLTALPLLLWALAAARITGLIAIDELTAPIRRAVVARFDQASRWQRAAMYTVGGFDDNGHGCPWCIGVWVAAATAPAIAYGWHIAAIQWATAALAVAQAIGATWPWGR
jgi:hypothetical protein